MQYDWYQCEECGEVSEDVTLVQIGDYEWESFRLCSKCERMIALESRTND